MKKINFLLLVLVLAAGVACAQEPFDIPMKDTVTYKTPDFTAPGYNIKNIQSSEITSPESNLSVVNQQNIGFSVNGSPSGVTPIIQTNIIKYRLGLYSNGTTRIYLPLVLLSKFSLNYDSIGETTLSDATQFLGSPLTMRLMPNWGWKIGTENWLYVGHISDFRTVLVPSKGGRVTPEFGYYGALGIKYSGLGDVRTSDGQRYDGSWSASVLAYVYAGTNNAQSLLFKDDPVKTGIEGLFRFKLAETKMSRFNLTASFQYQPNNLPGVSPWIFKFGIGN